MTDKTTILGTVRYNGASQDQINWGGNDDPRPFLTIGAIYDVIDIEMHSWHTKLTIFDHPDMQFNSASFEFIDETPLEKAKAKWRADHGYVNA